MATRDVRKESPQVIQELRRRAVELKKQGCTHIVVAEILDVSIAASRLWWRRYREGGDGYLKLQRRGRPTGAWRVLSKQQEKIVVKAITDKTPEQLKLPFALWTGPVIRRFILERIGIQLCRQPAASSHDELKFRLSKTMRSNQRRPKLIQSLFKHPGVVYTA